MLDSLFPLMVPLSASLPGSASAEEEAGFVRFLIESRFVAILFGVAAIVLVLYWLGWQMRAVRRHRVETSPEAGDGPPRRV